jgi:hypothetical protein
MRWVGRRKRKEEMWKRREHAGRHALSPYPTFQKYVFFPPFRNQLTTAQITVYILEWICVWNATTLFFEMLQLWMIYKIFLFSDRWIMSIVTTEQLTIYIMSKLFLNSLKKVLIKLKIAYTFPHFLILHLNQYNSHARSLRTNLIINFC